MEQEQGDTVRFIVHSETSLSVSTAFYEASFDLVEEQWSLSARAEGAESKIASCPIVCLPMQSRVHALDGPDSSDGGQVRLIGKEQSAGRLALVFETRGNPLWASKKYKFTFTVDSVTYCAEVTAEGRRIDDIYYFASDWTVAAEVKGADNAPDWRGGQIGFQRYYAPRFDWSTGIVYRRPDQSDSLNCQQWLSPPPFCYALEHEARWISCGVIAEPGQFNFLGFDYVVSPKGDFSLRLDFEGHTVVEAEGFRTPGIRFGFDRASCGNEAVQHYIQAFRDSRNREQTVDHDVTLGVPSWWKEPIFCGWGQQRYDYRRDHGGTENGHFLNVGAYATEYKYRSYTDFMQEKGIHPGTIIIDYKWAKQDALAAPDPLKWSDMRAFIEDQHTLGRKVLLWYSPLLAEGLPPEACMMLEGKVVAADPTSERYREIVSEQIYRMVGDGEGCLNADGLKIDFTQNMASERRQYRNYLSTSMALLNESNPEHIYPKLGDGRSSLIHTSGKLWGVEMLRAYLHTLYTNMKAVKPDAMLMAHTANPCFADVVDVLRLNDLDGTSPEVPGIMHNRAVIARMCNPAWLIDTDNDLMVDKKMWRNYLLLQPQIGIPVTYYLRGIAASNEPFDESDYSHLRKVWDDYRKQLQE